MRLCCYGGEGTVRWLNRFPDRIRLYVMLTLTYHKQQGASATAASLLQNGRVWDQADAVAFLMA